jgi:hypothetical protein
MGLTRKQGELMPLLIGVSISPRGGAAMNIRNLCNRFLSSMLTIGIVGALVGPGAHSVSAQSIIVTTPFSFCVNRQAYPKGRYRFTLRSQWILSIQNVNGEDEGFFHIRREDGSAQDLASGPMASEGGVTFRTFEGIKELQTVHEPGSDSTFELIGHGFPRKNLKTRRLLKPTNGAIATQCAFQSW